MVGVSTPQLFRDPKTSRQSRLASLLSYQPCTQHPNLRENSESNGFGAQIILQLALMLSNWRTPGSLKSTKKDMVHFHSLKLDGNERK